MTAMLSRAFAFRGSLQLRASRDDAGRTVLTHRHASGGFHLSKPYWDGRALLVQWINPTAGIFAGDRLESEVIVEPGAVLLLTTPSATRIHTRPQAHLPPGVQVQRFQVMQNAVLEVQPELLIPQKHSAFVQKTQIDLEPEASLFFAELIAPGRVAHGESLTFDSLDLRLVLKIAGQRVVQERLLAGAEDGFWKLRNGTGKGFFTGAFFIRLPGHTKELIQELRSLVTSTLDVSAAATLLNEGLILIRAVSETALALKLLSQQFRILLSRRDDRMGRNARKL